MKDKLESYLQPIIVVLSRYINCGFVLKEFIVIILCHQHFEEHPPANFLTSFTVGFGLILGLILDDDQLILPVFAESGSSTALSLVVSLSLEQIHKFLKLFNNIPSYAKEMDLLRCCISCSVSSCRPIPQLMPVKYAWTGLRASTMSIASSKPQ